MGCPNFLNRHLTVKIQPAILLLHSLTEMMKLAERAVLIARENKIQILAVVPYQGACTILDMESNLIISPWNSDGYSLLFRLQNWHHRLSHLILREPSDSLYITKLPGSNGLSCFFGISQHLIILEDAQFVIPPAVDMINNDCYVRVIMGSQQFREFILGFAASGHDHTVSAVQLHITRETIRWITPSSHHNHSAQEYVIQGLKAGAGFQFGLRWDWPLFQMLCSVVGGYDYVVISVFQNPRGVNSYGFRFFVFFGSYFFTYMENELVLQQEWC